MNLGEFAHQFFCGLSELNSVYVHVVNLLPAKGKKISPARRNALAGEMILEET
jgi:hypothetical protein